MFFITGIYILDHTFVQIYDLQRFSKAKLWFGGSTELDNLVDAQFTYIGTEAEDADGERFPLTRIEKAVGPNDEDRGNELGSYPFHVVPSEVNQDFVTWRITEYQFWANKSSELHKEANFMASMITATSGVLSPHMSFQIQRRFKEMGMVYAPKQDEDYEKFKISKDFQESYKLFQSRTSF